MGRVDQHFQRFLREHIYLHNVAPKSLSGIGTCGRSSNDGGRLCPATIDLALSSAALTCKNSSFISASGASSPCPATATCEASTHSVDGLHQEGQIPQPVRLSPLKLEKRLLAIHNEGALRVLLGYRPAVPGRDNPARVELRLAQGVPHALFDVLPMRSTLLRRSHPKSQWAVAERPPCQ
jgi:hypothetical protein